MKKQHTLYFSFLCIAVLIGMSACSKFLDEEPKDFLSPTNYYKTESDALASLVGAYDALGNGSSSYMARQFPYLSWFVSDEALPPLLANQKQLDNFMFGADHVDIKNLWNQIYDAINRANTVIEKVPAIEFDPGTKAQILAEAHFLRAFNYFNAIRLWGEVPLMSHTISNVDEALVENANLADLYRFVIADLELAQAELAVDNQDGRATKGAAIALLAKVYLTKATSAVAEKEDYQKCADLSKQVIDMGKYHLMPDFQLAIGGQNEFNPESIFEWQGDRNLSSVGEHSVFGQFTLPTDIVGLVPEVGQTGESNVVSEIGFFNKFNALDYRKESTFITQGTNRQGMEVTWQEFTYPFPAPAWKFVNKSSTTRNGYAFSANFVFLRLADVYLMRAEALNELNGPTSEAYEMINAIRKRARNGNGSNLGTYPQDLAGVSKEEFRDSVLQERAIELAFEGHRWFDLVRTNRLVETIKSVNPSYPVSQKHNLFPIPSTEIELNAKLVQNKGW